MGFSTQRLRFIVYYLDNMNNTARQSMHKHVLKSMKCLGSSWQLKLEFRMMKEMQILHCVLKVT